MGPEKKKESDFFLFKTELCRGYEEIGSCKYGSKCCYAHGKKELRKNSFTIEISRKKQVNSKTDVCENFHILGLCDYGRRCNFMHAIISPYKSLWNPSSPLNYLIFHSHKPSPLPIFESEGSRDWASRVKSQEYTLHPHSQKRLSYFVSICRK